MIKGKRVRIRPTELEDQAFITELNSEPAIRANVGGWDLPQSEYWQTQWYQSSRPGNTHRWIVENLEGHKLGLTGLWGIDWHDRNALTALKIGGQHGSRGRGFGSDAIKAVMAFAFYDVGLNRLHTTILSSNAPSLRAYSEHCNWKLEGNARKHVWRHGEYVDLLHLGVLKEEFDALPDASDYVNLVREGRIANS